MKCDELKARTAYSIAMEEEELESSGTTLVYLKSDVDSAFAELKAKLESVQASMYCDVVDANMENRRLKRALWLARAERAKEMCQRLLIQGFDPKWEEVERKCRAKAEQYGDGE